MVSRALSGTAQKIGISAAKVESIRDEAARLDYVPNASARQLRGAPSRTLGVMVLDFEDPFFGPILGELQRLAQREGYSLVLGGFEQRHAQPQNIFALLKHEIDGLIILGSETHAEWLRPFLAHGLTAVRLGHGPANENSCAICVDEEAGLLALVEHLAGLGHREIGFIAGAGPVHDRRLEICKRLLRKFDLPVEERWIARDSEISGVEAGHRATRSLLRTLGQIPSALVATNDLLALGALRALSEAGISVPQKISIAGFDDIPFAQISTPSLTTVRQPLAEMTHRVFECATTKGAGNRREIRFAPQLIVRESTRQK
jgi:DNA-binding LacI/PurR family transcriptional regulator